MHSPGRATRLSLVAAILVSVVVQVLALRGSWFFLDDVVIIKDARSTGFTWDYLSSGVARHFLPLHKVFDWVVAVPFGKSWTLAVALLAGSMAVGLGFLAALLMRVFTPSWRLAIPVAICGTAWIMISGAQWWAAGAGLYPSFAALCAAMYFHLRWRQGGSIWSGVAGLALTLVAVLFWIQAIVAAALLVAVVLAAGGEAPRSPRALAREVALVAPHLLLAVTYLLYARTQPYFVDSGGIPPLGDGVDLLRTVALRGLLPSLLGGGMQATDPTPHEETFQGLAALVVVALAIAGILARTRWCTAALLAALGIGLCTVTIAGGRLDEVGVAAGGVTPRYLMVGVLCGALALAAVLSPSGRPSRIPVPAGARALRAGAAALLLGAAGLYGANLHKTYEDNLFSRDSGQTVRRYAETVERQLRAGGDRRSALVSGTVPFPVYYPPPDPSSDLREVAPFFEAPVAFTGQPAPDGRLYTVGGDGAIEPARFRPSGRSAPCDADRCRATLARGSDAALPLYVRVEFDGPAPERAALTLRSTGGTPVLVPRAAVAIEPGTRAVTLPTYRTPGDRPVAVDVALDGPAGRRISLGVVQPGG